MKYEESYKFPSVKDPDSDDIMLTKVSMGSGSKYFLLTNLTGITLIKSVIPKISPRNEALEVHKFLVSFSLMDNNKYSMSTCYRMDIILLIKREVKFVFYPDATSVKAAKRSKLPPLPMKSNQSIRMYLPVISDFTMMGLMTVNLPEHVNVSQSDREKLPL